MQAQLPARAALAVLIAATVACSPAAEEPRESPPPTAAAAVPEPQFTLTDDQTHTKFSSTIAPVLTVPSGAVVEVFTHEATGGQLNVDSTLEDMANIDMDRIHTLTGPR